MLKKSLLRGAKRIGRDKDGNVAMLTGIVLLPIVAIMGFAVDLSITGNNRDIAAKALDSAILSAARARLQGLTDDQVASQFQTYFSALTSGAANNVTCEVPTLVEEGIDMLAQTTCTSQSMVAGATGARYVTFDLESRVTFGIGKLDIAFVFDVSGSMNWSSDYTVAGAPSRLEALKTAATSGVNNLLQYNSGDTDDIRIALVGYSSAVHGGDYFNYATGLTPTRTYSSGGDPGVQEVGTAFSHVFLGLYDSRTNELIGELRDNTVIRVTEDQKDNLAVAATMRPESHLYGSIGSLFLELNNYSVTRTENVSPYALYGDTNGDFYSGNVPTERWNDLDITGYSGSDRSGKNYGSLDFDFYIEVAEEFERTVTNYCTYERDSAEWDEATEPRTGHFLSAEHATFNDYYETWDDPDSCNSSGQPRALDINAEDIATYIDGMVASGGTAGHLGIAWGRYLMSPDWADGFETDHKPLAWDEPDSSKIMILMTDGEFNSTYHGNLGTSYSQAQAHCDDAKNNDNVLIYTIAFNAPQAGQDILNYCSSGSDFRFDANNGQELLDAYTAIAASISDLRLVSTPEGVDMKPGFPVGGGDEAEESHDTKELQIPT